MVLRRSRKTGSTPPWTELSGNSVVNVHRTINFLPHPQIEFCAGYLSLPSLATSADLSCAVEKAGAPFYFHTVAGAGHKPYFGLNFNSSGTNFEGSGGGIGVFENRSVEPLIFAFFRHYLLEGNRDLFTGEGVSDSTGKTTTSMHQ